MSLEDTEPGSALDVAIEWMWNHNWTDHVTPALLSHMISRFSLSEFDDYGVPRKPFGDLEKTESLFQMMRHYKVIVPDEKNNDVMVMNWDVCAKYMRLRIRKRDAMVIERMMKGGGAV